MNEEIKRHLTAILERLDGWESGGWEEYQATEKIPSTAPGSIRTTYSGSRIAFKE